MKILFGVFVCLLPFFSFAHEEESSVLISITSKGFEPSTLSIAPHTKVVFINRDKEGHWPASDRHPTHSDYSGTDLDTHCSDNYEGQPAFDSCRALAEGEAWSFIFEEAGTFHYHDHVWSHLGGTIIVETGQQLLRIEIWISSFIKWIKSFFVIDIDKLENELLALVESNNPKVAIDTLREKSHNNVKLYAVCHDLVHEIGRASYRKYNDIKITTSYQNEFCNSGYLHGVFEEYFSKSELSTTTVKGICSEVKNIFEMWQCNHGIGHGLMYKTGGHLATSLDACNTLLESPMAADMCQNAVYMELFNNEVLLNELPFIESQDPFKTCRESTYEKNNCHLYASTYFVKNHDWSFNMAMDMCMNLDDKAKISCIKGTVGEASRNIYNLESAFALCDRFEPGKLLTECTNMASSIIVFQTASIDESIIKCEDVGKYTERCKDGVKKVAPMFDPIY